MRQSIGATIANDLVFGALEMSPHAYNFDDFETNVITMDDESYEGKSSQPDTDRLQQPRYLNTDVDRWCFRAKQPVHWPARHVDCQCFRWQWLLHLQMVPQVR